MREVAEGALAGRVDEVRSWVFDRALPFWSSVGVDGTDGFVEHLSLDARPADPGYKRLRVQARQVYVYSHAALLGWAGGVPAAENGWRFMREHGWLDRGGWARRLGREGGVVDPVLDLYDNAFALLAIAWWTRATGDEEALGWADRTLEAIDRHLAAPAGRGWLSEDGEKAALLQNPHMHLLEALLALHATTGEARYRERIADLLGIFDDFLFDPATGTLAEYYDGDWRRCPGERGRIVEPGHHYEWVWLLHQAARAVPEHDLRDRADSLFSFAERHGENPTTGLISNELLDDGTVHDGGCRTWPYTEALKAHLARLEDGRPYAPARAAAACDTLVSRFLEPGPEPGTWIDQYDAEGAPAVKTIPASTLYHVFVAFSELLRLEPQVRAAEAAA